MRNIQSCCVKVGGIFSTQSTPKVKLEKNGKWNNDRSQDPKTYPETLIHTAPVRGKQLPVLSYCSKCSFLGDLSASRASPPHSPQDNSLKLKLFFLALQSDLLLLLLSGEL